MEQKVGRSIQLTTGKMFRLPVRLSSPTLHREGHFFFFLLYYFMEFRCLLNRLRAAEEEVRTSKGRNERTGLSRMPVPGIEERAAMCQAKLWGSCQGTQRSEGEMSLRSEEKGRAHPRRVTTWTPVADSCYLLQNWERRRLIGEGSAFTAFRKYGK